MTYSETVGKKLNILLEKTYDAEKGYKKAANNAKDTDLKKYFQQKSDQRYEFGHALKAEIRNFNQEIEKGGSAAGTVHRTWMDVKAFFSADNDEAMLEAAITGEKAAIDEYLDVLEETNLPPSTATMLTQQMNQISSDLTLIKRLDDIA